VGLFENAEDTKDKRHQKAMFESHMMLHNLILGYSTPLSDKLKF
jgi:hypothetical protein